MYRRLAVWALILGLGVATPMAARAQIAIAPANAASVDGATTSTAYEISELGNLVWLHTQAAAGLTGGKYYKLAADIDASATASWNDEGTGTDTLEGFNPIGTFQAALQPMPFQGVFLGQGHKITGLTVNRPGMSDIGLFGGFTSRVQDLGIEGGSMTGASHVGGLAGEGGGTVFNCHASCVVSGSSCVGGLIGNDYGIPLTVSNCAASGGVTGSSDYVGGLIGDSKSYGTISNCYAIGTVTGHAGYVGGLIGNNGTCSSVSNCYATGTVMGTSDCVGGLIGNNDNYLGISNCYATGADHGVTCVGGLIGKNAAMVVRNCFATGAVFGSSDNVGGLIGSNDSDGMLGLVTASYWNAETTGQVNSDCGEGLTTAQMKQTGCFTDWDFTSTWAISGGFPYLRSLATCTITYIAGVNGILSDGVAADATTLAQILNIGAVSAPVARCPVPGIASISGATASPQTRARMRRQQQTQPIR